MFASQRGKLEMVQCLYVDCEADVEKNTVDDCSPLSFAAQFGQLNVVQYLVEHCTVVVDKQAKV